MNLHFPAALVSRSPNAKRGDRLSIGVLILATGALIWLYWPSARERTLSRIGQLGGVVRIEKDENQDLAYNVIFIGRPITDQDVAALDGLGELPNLRLFLDGTKITDAACNQVREFSQ